MEKIAIEYPLCFLIFLSYASYGCMTFFITGRCHTLSYSCFPDGWMISPVEVNYDILYCETIRRNTTMSSTYPHTYFGLFSVVLIRVFWKLEASLWKRTNKQAHTQTPHTNTTHVHLTYTHVNFKLYCKTMSYIICKLSSASRRMGSTLSSNSGKINFSNKTNFKTYFSFKHILIRTLLNFPLFGFCLLIYSSGTPF